MKKNVQFLIVFWAILMSAPIFSQSIEVPETQYVLITKRTADWCPFCGEWGWDMFRGLIDDNPINALIMAAHYSGGLQSEAAKSITDNFGAFGQPIFYLGNDNQRANSSNYPNIRDVIRQQVTAEIAEKPMVQTGIEAVYNESHLVVNTNSKFFEETSGEFYLGVYAIEKEVISTQASVGPSAAHKNILRQSLSETSFGDLVAMGNTITADTQFSWTVAAPLDELPEFDNLTIATILWRKQDDIYQFINANTTETFTEQMTTSVEESQLVHHFAVYPTVSDGQPVRIELELPVSVKKATVEVLNTLAQPIEKVFEGPMQAGHQAFQWIPSNQLAAGTYFIRVQFENGMVTRPIIRP